MIHLLGHRIEKRKKNDPQVYNIEKFVAVDVFFFSRLLDS